MPQPCTPWVTGQDIQACCDVESSSGFEFADAAEQASELLFELSGRLFPGECGPKTVRPPCSGCACGFQVLSRGFVVYPGWWDGGVYVNLCDNCLISCSPSRVKLSGYPVREITEVKIDGDVLAADEYTLWKRRYLTRLDDGHWPYQQNLTLPDTEEGTFSISYTYGADPPSLGVAAAAQLGCELYKACADADDCALPSGVTRVTRQGITIEKSVFTTWAYQRETRIQAGGWKTGMTLVDAFLTAHNQRGLIRRPTFWSPGKRQYSQPFG